MIQRLIQSTVKHGFAILLIMALFLLWPGPEEQAVLAIPAVERMELANGMVALVLEEHSLPLVTFKLKVNGGSWRDAAGKEGLANLAAESLLLGTSERTAMAMNEELDSMGSSLEASCDRDLASFSLRTLKKDMERGFGLFMETLISPAFPEEEIHRQVENILGSLRSSEDQSSQVAEKAFLKALYEASPYGHPVQGFQETVAKLSREDVVRFYQAYYRPDDAILTIVGDVTPDEVKAKLVPILEKWQSRAIPEAVFVTTFADGPSTVEIDRPVSQASILIGHAGIARSNPDYYALSVMNYILGGGGFSSRLMDEIRVKKGLAYAVDSSFVHHKHPGSFRIELQTKNSSVREAIELAVREMKRIQEQPVSEKELETAKRYLIGSFPMRFASQQALAEIFAQVEYYGLGMDYPEKYPSFIAAVTSEDVQRVAKTYLHPDRCIVVVVADLEQAGMLGQ